eukprot:2791381-Rhodomonas_salina.2
MYQQVASSAIMLCGVQCCRVDSTAIVLRARYAKSGSNSAYGAMQRTVKSQSRSGLFSTGMGYAATHSLRDVSTDTGYTAISQLQERVGPSVGWLSLSANALAM